MPKAQIPDPPDPAPVPRPRSVARDTISGALLGAAFGLLLLGVGLIRAIAALLLGRHFSPLTAEDVRVMVYYIGSLAIAGGGLGTAKPLLRTRIGTYVGLGLAGAFVGVAVMMAFGRGDPDPMPLGAIIVVGGGLGAIMGSALAHGWLRGPS